MIRTPADLTAYLKAIASAHPTVRKVITGDDIRLEESTLSAGDYPVVDIDTPSHRIPIGEGQAGLSTRIFVYHNTPSGQHEDHDVNQDIAHRIAVSIVACIKAHTEDDFYGITLTSDFIIEPRLHMLSDNVSGWVIPISLEIDQHLCLSSDIDVSDVVFPQFKWTNSEEDPTLGTISLQDTSIVTTGGTLEFFWSEQNEQAAPALLEGNQIELTEVEDGPAYRKIKVWLRITKAGVQHYAFALIDTRHPSGWSVPFIPELPA